ncbi:MAG: peptidoglycan-binding protein [Oscillospiraceae bacterium]|jgi:g-D-glutamyl-meso-diaminopimelate peptidase|nr:peptidoglycan-binding protein [Oscillospiraceae bacterium]
MRTVREGDRGSIVALLQWGLRRAKVSDEAPDSVFGSRTLQAVRELQKANMLTEDGVAGAKTWAALHPFLTGFLPHTVKQGETLAEIAGHYGSTLPVTLAANPGVSVNDLRPGQTVKVPLPLPVVPVDIPWSFDLFALTLEGLQARFPFLLVESLGLSVLGRPIYQITVGRGKTRVGYNAAHHANEWITTPVLMKFLEQYAAGISQNSSIGGVDYRRLYSAYTLDLVPMVNPDGVDLVTGALARDTEAFAQAGRIAGEYPRIPFPAGWKANIRGVDLNLCYPAGWEKAKQIKYAQGYGKPAPRDFVGSAPLAAPEAAVMHRRALQANYQLTLSFHTQGELIYWKYANFNPAGSENLAKRMQGVSGYLPSVTPPESGNAGYKDWFIQQFNRPGYTIECGKGVNPLPAAQFDEIYANCFGILLLGMIGL